ncbi:phosphoribosylaminoimidazolesuccinocarboxamide synthase [Helicobacter pametensis]|uniref:phosphoribosylaminoimidazolesuccinocarboxamide synthase n=1 Tax=Helicobacter pametensis TaxID=95149 RepID=UPI000484B2E2|nr:phosphoribosylaminoimidazolesuccinocarboxamide synthase [Helicobacter pametensis]
MTPAKENLLYEGKAKKVFSTQDPNLFIVSYKDDATAFNGVKKDTLEGKGALNNRISNLLMQELHKSAIPTHLIKELSSNETLVKKLEMFALEVIVRNFAAGSITKRLGIKEGEQFQTPILEFCYKNDALGDPMINQDHILALGLASQEQIQAISSLTLQINSILSDYFASMGILLVDFKLEFGKDGDGKICLGDEISPDTCRFWDAQTKQKLDKDRFREDLGDVVEAYEIILHKILSKASN